MRSLRRSPSGQGLSHVASDGVLRSFSSQLEVVDYKQLSPEQIELVWKSMEGLYPADALREFVERMRGVDGRDVTDDKQLLHPGPELRPVLPRK